MDGCSGRSVWSGRRKSLNHRGHRGSQGNLAMRYCFGIIFSVVLLAGCALGQNSAPISLPPATPAVPVSKPIDLKPDASGAVPAEQIRELLRRAEENDLENDKRQRDYTYIEHMERHEL